MDAATRSIGTSGQARTAHENGPWGANPRRSTRSNNSKLDRLDVPDFSHGPKTPTSVTSAVALSVVGRMLRIIVFAKAGTMITVGPPSADGLSSANDGNESTTCNGPRSPPPGRQRRPTGHDRRHRDVRAGGTPSMPRSPPMPRSPSPDRTCVGWAVTSLRWSTSTARCSH